MSDYRIFQAQILAKDPVTPRAYSVVEIPNGQKLVGVQLGNALKDQSAPLLGSIVIVLQLDAFRSYILMILREPFTFITTNNQYRGFIPSTGNASQDIAIGANPIQDGEIFMEATGPSSPNGQSIPGFGAHLYLGNSGVAQIESGAMSERLIIGGEGTSDDHEVVLSADNGYFESNSGTDNIQSTFNYLTNSTTGLAEGLQVATQISVPVGLTTVNTPICQLTMDTAGNISLENTTFGTGLTAGALNINATGEVTLLSGASGVAAATLTLQPTGIININSGTLGAARLNDSTIANPVTDPAFWTFWIQQQAIFAALPPATDPGTTLALANALKAAMVVLLSTFPQSITGIITSSSDTVLIGN
jgi:hypothetical protein